jgi:hypothetical protein
MSDSNDDGRPVRKYRALGEGLIMPAAQDKADPGQIRDDIELLTAAIQVSGLSARRFAMEVLGVDERSVRRWLAGDRELQATARVVCRAIIARPQLAQELSDVTLKIQEDKLSGRQ